MTRQPAGSGAVLPTTDDPATPPVPHFDVPTLRSLFNAAQSGQARQLAGRCSRWDAELGPGDPRRWWVLVVWFITVQGDPNAADPLVLSDRLLHESTLRESPSAEAVARAARALTRAALGQPASAIADLGRATALLGAVSSAPAGHHTPDELYLRALAANLVGLGLMRSGLYAEARTHLRAMLTPDSLADHEATAPAVARFNIAWTHLADGLEASTSGHEQRATECFGEAVRWFSLTVDDPALRADGSWLRSSALALAAAAGDLADHPDAPAALHVALERPESLRADHAAVCRLAAARRRRICGELTQAAALLTQAQQDLPTQYSFRTISFAVLAESIRLERAAAPSSARDDVLRDTLRVLVTQRLKDRQALDADYTQATERARALLDPADLTSISVDALTGVRDRRALPELEQLLSDPPGDGWTGCLAFLDLDELKRVNDRLGHPVGDQVLRLFGAELRRILRPGDLAIRYGGDEFVVLLSDRSPDRTNALLDTVAGRFAARAATLPGIDSPVTFSRGISVTRSGANLAELLLQADRALLQSKHPRHPIGGTEHRPRLTSEP